HIQLNEIGNVILKYWQNISKQFPNVTLDKFVIMPNHIHGIIQINDNDWQTHGSAKSDGQTHGSAPTTISIPKIMQWFKTKTTNEYIRYVHAGICQPYEKRFWQRNYYEHIIRDDDDLNRIREYIQNNPVKWHEDELFSK
ncbi:MAG: transposase, partial [Patescibacteria group bacterium]